MAVNLIGDSAFGLVFDGLVQAVLEATHRVTTFSSSLNNLKSTLFTLKWYFDQLETLNRELHSPQRETDMFILRLAEGENLVRNCSRIKWWNLYKKNSYSKKITDLEQSLIQFFQLEVQADMYRDHKKLLVGQADLHKRLNVDNDKLDHLLDVQANMVRDQKKLLVGQVDLHKRLNVVNDKLDQLLYFQQHCSRILLSRSSLDSASVPKFKESMPKTNPSLLAGMCQV